MGDSVILRLTEWAEGMYRAVKFAKMIIETSMSSQNLSGRSKVSLIHQDQILGISSILNKKCLSYDPNAYIWT